MKAPGCQVRPFGGYKELFAIAWPLIVSTGSFALLHFCDRMFLAWYSEDTFRAVIPAGILFYTLVCGFVALAAFTNTFVAQFYGAGDRPGCARATSQGIFFALLSWPLILALIPVGLWALAHSGHGVEVLKQERIYFKILMWGSLSMPMNSALSSFFSGRGKTKVIMICNVFSNTVNIVLDYALIFGKWGFPELGIAGAGWATLISSWIAPLIMGVLFFSPHINRQYATRQNFRFDSRLFMRMIRFGLPAGIHLTLDVSAFTLFVLFIGRMGPVAHVGSNIALSINLIAFMPMTGIGMAASVLVGQYIGRNQPHYAARMGWMALRVGLIYTLCIAATFLLFPSFYISFFARNAANFVSADELYPLVRRLLVFLSIWGTMDASAIIMSGALKGAGDTHFVMYFQTALAWGFLVVGQVIIVFVLKLGVYASWLWTVCYIILLGIGFIWRFRSGCWKKIRLLERPLPLADQPIPVEY